MSGLSPIIVISKEMRNEMTPKQMKWQMAIIVTANAKKLEEANKAGK
jgi:hypothetical protein